MPARAAAEETELSIPERHPENTGEAMMSAPIDRAEDIDAEDIDAALTYAPPRVRDQLPPMPAATPIEWPLPSRRFDNSRHFSGDRSLLDMRRRLALEPEWILQPSQSSADMWRLTVRMGGILGIAAFVAGVIVLLPKANLHGRETVQASSVAALNPNNPNKRVPSPAATSPQQAQPDAQVDFAEKAAQATRDRLDANGPPAPTFAAAPPTKQEPPATTREQPALARPAVAQPAVAQPATPVLITRQLDPAEVTSLLKRGEDFINSGDLSSARLLLQRAAEAGDVRAAFALASTFDPNMLKKLGLQDVAADIVMARLWYQRAETFGSAEAPRRLQQLATATNSVP
jgi:hypothetical protein